ncbi:metallo-beta-lactamase superfamily protein [Histomonas meleagridis]|uniref:metallo-beta-lactamase superfamily protein n=1 Tax=Histomonas meleagridis TaxID=135588 RepID=UPI00355A77FF|nr:metallo-beta-lactamase superfamily protein [Histomonas meleagridis]KAH0802596.1 metallo-beta-lactamase superfamily protein [Histomonas meleagridis]
MGGFQGLAISSFEAKKFPVNYSAPEGFNEILETYSKLHTNFELIPSIIKNYVDSNISVTEHKLVNSVAYQVKLCDIPGKFLPEKAIQIGVPKGPLFKDLVMGKNVTLPNGTIVTPDLVKAPPHIGETVFFVNCYSPSDIQCLPTDCNTFDFVVHFTHPSLLFTPEYLSHFDPNQKSVCFSETGHITFHSISELYTASIQISNRLWHPLIEYDVLQQIELPLGFHEGHPKLQYAFAPFDKRRFIEPTIENIEPHLEEPLPQFNDFMVTFLGTGSTYPSKYRNVSGILIHTHSGYIVLDAGEGFAFQLQRKYGPNNLRHILSNILCIWISHIHGDHHFGLYQLLQKRSLLCNTPVPLICHPLIERHMQTIQQKVGSLNYIYYPHNETFKTGNTVIESIPVIHCIDSYGCVCTIDGGWRVAYSGDRASTDNFPKVVGCCDLLIHEATFTDDLIENAIEKKHCTLGQAINAGVEANARYVIMTHFSQRYPKVPVFNDENENIAFAFDYMSCKFEDIEELCKVCPEVMKLIQEREEKDEK